MTKIAPNLTFQDLTFTVQNGKEKKTILNEISGTFPSGKLIAIVGPSGAGKSTLLNILSGWDHNTKITGSINWNNKERKRRDIKRISCYITQESNLINILTVEENLKYTADLKLGRGVSQSYKSEVIKQVTKRFGLTEHLETQTGKLSGGQRKRLAICLELLSDPDIIFLDEPTTGLDSVSASQCVRYLQQLAKKGKSVICTMHQPPGNIMNMFDIVYIISKGQCLYQGGADKLVTFLADNGAPCDLFHSPIDYAIELASEEYGPKVLKTLMNTSQNGKNYAYMPIPMTKETRISNVYTPETEDVLTKQDDYSVMDDWFEFKTIIKRETTVIKRDWLNTYFRLTLVIVMSTMIGCVCYDLGADASMLFFNYNMVLLHISCLTIMYAVFTCVNFVLNQNVVRNEYENGYYSIRNYYLSSSLMDLPVTIVAVISESIIIYTLSGQYMTFPRIFMFIFLSVQISMIAGSIGCIAGSMLNLAESVYLSALIHIPIMALSGFGITIPNIPIHFYYATYLAYTRYGVRSLMGAIMGYDKPANECPEDAFYCHYRYSIKFLNEMGLEDDYFVYDALTLAGFYVLFRYLGYLIIKYKLKNGIYDISLNKL